MTDMWMIIQISDKNIEKYCELSELYEDEFAPLTGASKNENGIYPISTQIDETHIGYFMCNNGKMIGFIVINIGVQPFDVCEFFILKEYRNQGLGQELAFKVFDLYDAIWKVKQLYNAKNANSFWINIINKYTKGNYTQQVCNDEKWGKVYMQNFASKKTPIRKTG